MSLIKVHETLRLNALIPQQDFDEALAIVSATVTDPSTADWALLSDIISNQPTTSVEIQPANDCVAYTRLLRGIIIVVRNKAHRALSDIANSFVPLLVSSLYRFCSMPNGPFTNRCFTSYLEALANFRDYTFPVSSLDTLDTIVRLAPQESRDPLVHFLAHALKDPSNIDIEHNLLISRILKTPNSSIMTFLLSAYDSVDFLQVENSSPTKEVLAQLLRLIISHEAFGLWLQSYILRDPDVQNVLYSDNIHPDFTRWLQLCQVLVTAMSWGNEYQLTPLLMWIFDLYLEFQALSIDALTSSTDDKRLHIHITVLLDLISELCQYNQGKEFFLHYNLVDSLIPLLRKVHEAVPPITLKERETRTLRFAHVKSIIIEILAYLTVDQKPIQEKLRTLHAMEVILSSCIIDENNPFMKERAILCLRYALANNVENQKLVSQLEAKNTADESVLQEVGYEVEMVDGKMAIKKKDGKN